MQDESAEGICMSKQDQQSRRMKELFQSAPERKDRRVSLLLKESVYDKLQQARKEAGARSLNDFAGRLLEMFVNGELVLQDDPQAVSERQDHDDG